ncbi:hypothetical protein [Priestia koreensis]|uniref:Uncharacterized protein n=1 Tax=Priestia koreensis TaxID=284581 RepID=A0A0M0LBV4_9BACI|nr:hypothetical protein [Priestia koreensis]KOO48545.1 hypothetical protein AMD01_04785 [Priestia koreensis]
MINLIQLALIVCISMSIILIYAAYWEAINICNQEEKEKVNGLSMITFSSLGLTFSLLASHFQSLY